MAELDGYGGFLYGRGVYGTLQTYTGVVASVATASSTIASRVTPKINMAPSVWTERSTISDASIKTGRIVETIGVSTTRTGSLHARARRKSAAAVVGSVNGTGAHAGVATHSATSSSRIVGSLHAMTGAVDSAIETDSVLGRALHIGAMQSSADEASTSGGYRMAIGRKFDVSWLNSTPVGVITAAGAAQHDAFAVDAVRGNHYVVSAITTGAQATDTIDGRKLWEDDAPEPDPGWTAQPVAPGTWTPQQSGASPWAPVHR